MSFFRFVKIIIHNILLVCLVPMLLASLVFWLTQDEVKTYSSSISIYTGIASGFNVDMRQGVGNRFMIESVFENILTIMKSKEVKEKVAVQLLAQHLLVDLKDSIDYRTCTSTTIEELHNLIPEEIRKELVVKDDFEKTCQKIMDYLHQDHFNKIYRIVHSPRYIAHYSIKALNELSFKRIKTSDLVEIKFSSIDPGVCQNTLLFFSQAFVEKYREVKVSETNDIVSYFENKLDLAQTRLENLEADLLAFRSSNNILDYTEQVRAIAQRKEEMEGQIYKERMDLEAAKTTRQYTEEQLDKYLDVLSENSEILQKKDKLQQLVSQLAVDNLFDTKKTVQDTIQQLTAQISTLRSELEESLEKVLNTNFSTSGIKAKDILKKWFENIIDVGKSNARLQVFAERKQSYQQLYTTLAPVGSNLTKIEREVAVAEGAYLRILEALNLARMRQQNIALSTKLKIVEPPLFPRNPDPSKRKLLVVIAFLVGGALIIGVLIILEFLDHSIRQPSRLMKQLDLPIASAFPLFPKKRKGGIKYDEIETALTARLVLQLQKKLVDVPSNQTPVVAIGSMQPLEGKSYLLEQLQAQLKQRNKQVTTFTAIRPEELRGFEGIEELTASSTGDDAEAKQASQPTENNSSDKDYLLLELPHLQACPLSYDFWKKIDALVLVVSASRSWTLADKQLLNEITNINQSEPLLFLNGLKLHFLEEMLGEIPRKRSKVRQWMRRLTRFEFRR